MEHSKDEPTKKYCQSTKKECEKDYSCENCKEKKEDIVIVVGK